MKVTILGSSAGGIPQVDCMECHTCLTAIAKGGKNRRTMTSIAIENKDGFTLIDADPDLRFQLEREKIRLQDITEIFLTHVHGDHTFGLYQLSTGRGLMVPVYSKKKILDMVFKKSFDFLEYMGFARPVPVNEKVTLHGMTFKPFGVPHTATVAGPTVGYNVMENGKKLTYVPDIADLTQDVQKSIDNSDVLIIDGVFFDQSRVGHIAITESIPILQKLEIGEVIFTHMNHTELTHEELEEELKPYGYKVAYDGMKIKI
jgi:pyrroloquinoline quinone biosynthesis protein B